MNNDVLQALLQALENHEAVALLNVTDASGDLIESRGAHCLYWHNAEQPPVGDLGLGTLTEQVYVDAQRALDKRKHRHVEYATETGSAKVFIEVQVQPPHLIIVGAGHIAVPLASIATTCDFEVTVLDDRPQYAHPARFPTAQRVISGPFRSELQKLRGDRATFEPHTYIVLVTRGHQYDIESLLEVLDDPIAYIGMIGSQRRIRAVFELLEKDQGIPAAKFDRIYAPIGIDIGARTPAEIAVCIMAEIINVMRGGPSLSLSEQIRQERVARRMRAGGKS